VRLFVFTSLPAIALPASAAPSASHPLLGIWVLAIPQFGYSETYHFRGDGTTLVKSAQEVSESEFTVAEKPSVKGFYKLEDRIVKDNGKQDCSGEVMQTGTRATNYLRFHPSCARFVMCWDESMEAASGPSSGCRRRGSSRSLLFTCSKKSVIVHVST
jgi:hypothetical protein